MIEATSENASFGVVGSQRCWGGSHPGRLIETVLQSRIANPVMVVDAVAAKARAKGGDFREAFLAEYWRINVDQSIFLHEGRHVLDQAAGKAAGGYADVFTAARDMGKVKDTVYHPIAANAKVYDKLFAEYRVLHDYFGRGANDVMKRLKAIKASV